MKSNSEQLVFHVPNELFQPSAIKQLDGCFFVEQLHGQFDTFSFENPIEYKITITNTGDAFLISGSASASGTTSCSRCLEDTPVNLNAKIDAYYLIEAPEEQDSEINEFEILNPQHDIPLGDIIKASLLVDAPLKPLCSDNCKGLCPKCGKNLNESNCNCKNEIDESSPFAALKNLKLKD